MNVRVVVVCLFFLWFWIPSLLFAEPLKREVLALYSTTTHTKIVDSFLHNALEVVFNYHGIKVRYHDVERGLPTDEQLQNVAGVVSWFAESFGVVDPDLYLNWAEKVIQADKKFLIFGEPGFFLSRAGVATDLKKINRFLKLLGIESTGDWVNVTHSYRIARMHSDFMGFERSLQHVTVPFYRMRLIDSHTLPLLTVRSIAKGAEENVLVALSPHGAFISPGYGLYESVDPRNEDLQFRQWYVNPFALIEHLFLLQRVPKPDVTTSMGRRIYFSHVDGDGWKNISDVPEYRKNKAYASEVILGELVRPYPQLPVTIGAIGAEMDLAWEGNDKARRVAKEIYALPQVEAGSHTFTHPFYWEFFADRNWQKEKRFLRSYQHAEWGGSSSFSERWHSLMSHFSSSQEMENSLPNAGDIPFGYRTPRAYARKPFDLHLEVQGSLDAIHDLLPKGKAVKLYQWSGSAQPFEAAIAAVEDAGVFHINGGSARFDDRFPSYAWMYPIGREVGKYWQIYAPNSNENVYTGLWSKAFHGFKYVQQTFERTDAPYRIRPINAYYHCYSGEKIASLEAVKSVLNYVRTLPIHPMFASEYASMAQGFFSVEMEEISPGEWEVRNRGTLHTIRLDHATLKTVDYLHSYGVIGHRHLHGALYVALDAAVERPRITFTSISRCCSEPKVDVPVLEESSWGVFSLSRGASGISGNVRGFGPLSMIWRMPLSGAYQLRVRAPHSPEPLFELSATTNASGRLVLSHEFLEAVPEGASFELLPSS